MTVWPSTLDEDETLDAAIKGVSLARFGDGEINLMLGKPCVTQKPSKAIAAQLQHVLKSPIPGLLVCLPRMAGPKAEFWGKYDKPSVHRLFPGNRYGSAFVTRPDSAPGIDRKEYWQKLRQLWAGRHVTLVRGSGKSLTADMLHDAASVHEVLVPKRNAFEHVENIMGQIGFPKRALLCCGPAATIMAHDLARHGVHAVDLGHVGMFLRKHINGEPMAVTDEDKSIDKVA